MINQFRFKKALFKICLFLSIISICACGPKPWDEPPLHNAAKIGDLKQVKALIKQGIDVNSKNKQGATPLHWAAFKGHVDVAKVLIKHGAKVNLVTNKDSTPLRLATTHKQTKMIKYLKSKGAR